MTDYPTIRIKCDPANTVTALLAAASGLEGLAVGCSAVHSYDIPYGARTFHVKRTKTGVTVRQIEGKVV